MPRSRSTPSKQRRLATAHDAATEHPASSPTGDAGRFLATAISWNAVFSAASGMALLGGWFVRDSWLGVDDWLLVGVGGGLVVFAGLLLWLLSQPRHLRAGARLVVAADAAWVAGAVLLLAGSPSALPSAGSTALAVVSAVVAALAVLQVAGLRRVRSSPVTGASPLAVRVQRIIAAPAERVWHAVADAGDYARFAPGIGASAIISGEGQGMVRVCTDDLGGQWAERCTLWDEGTSYRMTVDVGSYPIYYRLLLHELAQTWTVEATAGGTRLTLSFNGAVKLGVLGRLAARLLGNPRRLEAILDAYDRDLTETPQPR